MKNAIFLLAILTTCLSCTNTKRATATLVAAGLHPVKVGGYRWTCCAPGEPVATGFEAWNADSTALVRGCVCSSFLGGSTIRYK